ncbi:MAG: hypothetical protein ACJAQ3_004454, partial [Planctomycetota bacterium]
VDVSTGAVRQRLYRGMERLREKLDAETEGGRRKWLTAAAALVRRSTSATAHGAAGSSTAAATLGWVLPTVAALSVLVGLAWAFKLPASGEATGAIQVPPMAAVAAPEKPFEVEPLAVLAAERTREPLAVESGIRGGPRTFRILHPKSGAPIPRARWYALATGARDPEPFGVMDPEYLPPAARLASGITDSDGVLEVPSVQGDLYQLIICRGLNHAAGSFAVDAQASSRGTTDLVTPVGTSLKGRFVDTVGEPLAGAEIMEYDLQEVERTIGESDANGRFEIPGMGDVPRQLVRLYNGSVVSTWSESSRYFVRAQPDEPWVGIPTWNAPKLEAAEVSTKSAQGQEGELGDVIVKRPSLFRSKVLDEEGRAVKGARVGYGHAHEATLWVANAANVQKDHPWGNSASNQIVLSDENGAFELPVFRPHSSAFHKNEVVAVAPDGRQGALRFTQQGPSATAEPEIITVTGEDRIRLILEDRLRPGNPIVLPKGAQRLAAWRRLETARGTAIERPDTSLAEILSGGAVSIRVLGLRRGTKRTSIELEIPGYEIAIVEIPTNGGEKIVSLDRRSRRSLTIRFTGGEVLVNGNVNVALMSRAPDVDHDLQQQRPLRSTWPSTAYAGNLALGLTGGETVELFWPSAQPAWIVVYPNPPGIYATPEPTVIGPLMAPKNGSTLEIPIVPWVLTNKWGPPDLSRGTVVPLY